MNTTPSHVRHLIVGTPDRLTLYIERELSLSSGTAQKLLSLGGIYRNKKRIETDLPCETGDYLRIHCLPRRYPVDAISWPERILENNEAFVIVDKPGGIPVHATLDNAWENVLTLVSRTLSSPLFVTHRLDVPTRGLLVFAKTLEFQTHFNNLLLKRQVRKHYRALLPQAPPLGRWIHYQEPSHRQPKVVSRNPTPGWLPMELAINKVGEGPELENGKTFEASIALITGRTHQIRCQLACEQLPILGDSLYGDLRGFRHDGGQTIALEACELEFDGHLFRLEPSWNGRLSRRTQRETSHTN